LFAELTSSQIVQLEQIKYGKFDGLGVVLDHSSAIESGWEVSFGHQCSNTKLMKTGIYSPLISPPITPCTSNKLNKVDLMGREWFFDRLSAMESSRKGW
jgi:hypothetical protein